MTMTTSHLPRQFNCGVLALLRWPANGVNESHFGLGKSLTDQSDQAPHLFNRLRRLRGDAEARAFG